MAQGRQPWTPTPEERFAAWLQAVTIKNDYNRLTADQLIAAGVKCGLLESQNIELAGNDSPSHTSQSLE